MRNYLTVKGLLVFQGLVYTQLVTVILNTHKFHQMTLKGQSTPGLGF